MYKKAMKGGDLPMTTEHFIDSSHSGVNIESDPPKPGAAELLSVSAISTARRPRMNFTIFDISSILAIPSKAEFQVTKS
jgi:hypothetical protein